MHRSVIAASIAILVSVAPLWSAPLDDAAKAIDRVGTIHSTAGDDLRELGDVFVRHVNALAELAKRMERAAQARRETAPLIARAIEIGNADLAAARTEMAVGQRAVREAEAAAVRAKASVAARRAAMAQVDRAEREAFEASEAFRTTEARAKAAEDALAAVERQGAARLAGDPAVAPLIAEAEQARKAADLVRRATPVDDAALAEASARSIDAANRLAVATAAFHQRDGRHVEAAEALRAARQTRTAMRDAFDRSILMRPGVAEAKLDLVEAAHAAADAERDAAAERDALGRLGATIASRRASVQVLMQLDRDATDRVDVLANDVKAMRETVLLATREVGEVAKRLVNGKADVREAGDAVDRAKADQAKSKK